MKFLTARNHESVLNYWDKIGTPSDNHRWCCSVMKTAPLYRMLMKKGEKRQKFLAFEGVRAEESAKRSDYNRIGKGVKHGFVINARPILKWNTTEVYLYLMRYNLHINEAYRIGKPRVGCVLCPFGSPWDDMIVNNYYPQKLSPFLKRIESSADRRRIPNKMEYVAERKWKLRSSGKFSESKTSVIYSASSTKWQAAVVNAEKDIFEWLPVLGKYSIKKSGLEVAGELLFKKEIFNFSIQYKKDKKSYTFIIYDNNNISLRYYLRRLINKATYCINCEACELECPTGALSVYPNIEINEAQCIHCYKCLDYHNIGCIVADSKLKPIINSSNMKISKYGTFGIHQEWVDQYLSDSDSFWDEQLLGVKQIPSFKAWLKDADIIDASNSLTTFGNLCIELNKDSPILLWELIYVNLCYNSPLMQWYVSSVDVNNDYSRKDLDTMAIEYFQNSFKESTIKYAIQALVQSFKYSPIGEDFMQFAADAKFSSFKRLPFDEVSPEAVAYSLYKYARAKGLNMMRVSDLYNPDEKHGIYREFGISKNELLKKLRYLSSDKNRVLVAELAMGLDHITLREDLSPYDVLKTLTE